MQAAHEAGATVFLVPADNCDEAKSAHEDSLELVKVDSQGRLNWSRQAAIEELQSRGEAVEEQIDQEAILAALAAGPPPPREAGSFSGGRDRGRRNGGGGRPGGGRPPRRDFR